MKKKLYHLFRKFARIEFIRYFIVGVVATLVDWGVFYLLALVISLYYQFSLVISFSLGSVANYVLNKIFTFRCRSKKIIGQFSVFLIISIISLLLSMAIMFVLVDVISAPKMVSRITTTFIMLIVNYLMHKYITFNKRFFK